MGDYGAYKRLKAWNIEIHVLWDPTVWVVEVRRDKAGTEPAEAYTFVCINVNVNAGLQGYGKHTKEKRFVNKFWHAASISW